MSKYDVEVGEARLQALEAKVALESSDKAQQKLMQIP